MDTIELTDEMRKRIEDVYVEADKLTTVIVDATKRRDDLRGYLKKSLETIGLELGQGLRSERLGLSAMLVRSERHKIDRDALISLGVPERIIDTATVTTKTRSHVRFGRTSVRRSAYSYLGGNENVVTNVVTRPRSGAGLINKHGG